jgi:uncharacterized protein
VPPLPLAGEGWGEGRRDYPHPAPKPVVDGRLSTPYRATFSREREKGLDALSRLAAACLVFAVALTIAWAATDFPALTGRVVDQAGVLSAATRAELDGKLATLEQKSGIQLVVATVATLGGQEIEPYANDLFRQWKLGEAKKNDGVLFLVAPKEHKVRIEVGYGLEGTLTDAISKIIILNAVAPHFKTGDFDGGVSRGIDDITTVLTTDSSEWQKKPDLRAEDDSSTGGAVIAFVIILLIVIFILRHGSRGGGIGNAIVMSSMLGSDRSSGGGGFGGGGFSGGGGSSGGGGASGSW